MQDHAAAATATDPNVQYAYEDGSGGADLDANFVRPDYVTYPGPSARRVVYYNYASTGVGAPMSRLDNIASAGSPTASQKYASYMYLGAGTMVDANYPAVTGIPALTYGSRANSYAGLDRFGRVVDQKWQNQNGTPTVNDRFKYAYDRTSNRTSRDPAADSHTPPDANDNYYTYDGLDRLTQSNRGNLDVNGAITDQNADANQVWSLDTVGNWSQFKWDADGGGAGTPITQTRAHNTANEIAGNGGNPISGTGAANWVDPAYDAAGNMISGPQPRYETVDANSQWYKYDAWNRLTRVGQGTSSPGTLVATYSYDGQNRRIRKVVEAGETDITYDYYYNESWQVLEVRKGESQNAYQQYVWGLQYIDAPVVSFMDGNLDGDVADQGDNTLYYTYDGNFNVTALVGTDGTVAERYTYDPYGKVTFKAADWSDAASQAKSAYDNEILYCGYRFDPESGNYIVRLRYLTPPLGRWLTNDPIGYEDGMNLYQYVRSTPTRYRDPSGKVTGVDDALLVAGAANAAFGTEVLAGTYGATGTVTSAGVVVPTAGGTGIAGLVAAPIAVGVGLAVGIDWYLSGEPIWAPYMRLSRAERRLAIQDAEIEAQKAVYAKARQLAELQKQDIRRRLKSACKPPMEPYLHYVNQQELWGVRAWGWMTGDYVTPNVYVWVNEVMRNLSIPSYGGKNRKAWGTVACVCPGYDITTPPTRVRVTSEWPDPSGKGMEARVILPVDPQRIVLVFPLIDENIVRTIEEALRRKVREALGGYEE